MATFSDIIGEQFQRYIADIWEWLMKDDGSVIGVCGMGGVGKTTLLKHVYVRLLENFDAFDYVKWVTVRQDYSIFRLQNAFAKSFDLHLSDQDDKATIAARLLHAFEKTKKCVIILDDVWDVIHLEDVGIPLKDGRIKLIIASRLFQLCQSLGCKGNVLKVKPLSWGEAWDFFLKTLGDHRMLSPEIMKIARSITIECEGLPLAIDTMAIWMRREKDIRKWKYVLEKIRNTDRGQENMKKYVFPKLRLSYNHLNDKILQECFLDCALYYRFDVLKREDLILNLVDKGLINGKESLEAQFDEGRVILNKLIDSNLLEERDGRFLSFHRVVRAMAVSIANEECSSSSINQTVSAS